MNDMLTTIIRFFQDGGPFMYPIMIVLAIGLAITLERWLHLSYAKSSNRRMIAKLMPLMEKGEVASASKLEDPYIDHNTLIPFKIPTADSPVLDKAQTISAATSASG